MVHKRLHYGLRTRNCESPIPLVRESTIYFDERRTASQQDILCTTVAKCSFEVMGLRGTEKTRRQDRAKNYGTARKR